MIIISHKGNFKHTERLFYNWKVRSIRKNLEKYAQEGLRALISATPVLTGLTRDSWGYEVKISKNSYTISWTNSNIQDGVPIALVIQYGHVTINGGYVPGYDYINPALQPIFNKIVNEAWWEVTK